MSARDPDVVIVGAGHNGLVAAAYLARAGLRVHLMEARSRAGGACVTEELWPGMRFSTCAHVLHGLHPSIVRELRLVERGLEVLSRSFSVFPLRDGTYWGPADHPSPRNLTPLMTAPEREGEARYETWKRTLSRFLARYRTRTPPGLDELIREARGAELDVLLTAVRTRASELRKDFLCGERLRDKHASDRAFISRDPLALSFASDSVNQPDEETGEKPLQGYVRGGMGELGRLFVEAAEEAGAVVLCRKPVERLIVEGARIVGVRLKDGTEIRARLVISNLDPKATILGLLPPEAVPSSLARRIAALPTNVGSYKFLATLSELPQWSAWDGDPLEPSRGGVGLCRSRSEVAAAFDDLEAGRPPRAPVVSFSVPSTLDPSQTRPGYHTASVWIFPAPGKLASGEWSDRREEVAERLIDQITEYAPNFRRSIVQYKLRTPQDIGRMHGMTDGCIWHVQHEGEHMLGNRPLPELAAYRAHLAGLYLCGAGQHPGGEITGLPGRNAAKEVLRDLA